MGSKAAEIAKIDERFAALVESLHPNFLKQLCPTVWCRIGYIIARSGLVGRFCQVATAGSLTMGSSLKPAMVSSVM